MALDSNYTERDHSWGTYTVEDSILYLTVTGSETNPEFIGETKESLFTAEPDRLIIYTLIEEEEPVGDYYSYIVYSKQE